MGVPMIRCAWAACGVEIPARTLRGHARRYCSAAHRYLDADRRRERGLQGSLERRLRNARRPEAMRAFVAMDAAQLAAAYVMHHSLRAMAAQFGVSETVVLRQCQTHGVALTPRRGSKGACANLSIGRAG
jgi:AraC-like DNA-binding protein